MTGLTTMIVIIMERHVISLNMFYGMGYWILIFNRYKKILSKWFNYRYKLRGFFCREINHELHGRESNLQTYTAYLSMSTCL